MSERVIIHSRQFELIMRRLCYELIEHHGDFSEAVLIGLQPRGIYVANRLQKELERINPNSEVSCGALDITFYRDDFRRREKPLLPSATNIDFIIEGKKVVLIDDVFYTGRTARSGLDAMLAFGRPSKVELLAFIERRFSAQLPISPDYVGSSVDTIQEERVEVQWKETEGEDKVILYRKNEH